MTCADGAPYLLFGCLALLVLALAALLVSSSAQPPTSSEHVFAAVILAASALALVASIACMAIKCSPDYVTLKTQRRAELTFFGLLSKACMLGLSVLVIALGSMVVEAERGSGEEPSEAQRARIVYASVILVVAIASAVASLVTLALQCSKYCRTRTSQIAIPKNQGLNEGVSVEV